jgi:diacylglycerol O-acyltransferase / wax synthase
MVTRIKSKKSVSTPHEGRAGGRVPPPSPSGHSGSTQRMSKVDTAWLRMDGEHNLMMIVGVWILRPGLKLKEVSSRIESRFLKFPRFGQRVQQDSTGASWVTDEDFRIERHVVAEVLPRVGKAKEQSALQSRLAELAMEPLDIRHPLWQFRLVEDYQGGSALMCRIHHCIADGLALIAVTQSMVDGGLEPPKPPTRADGHDGLEGLEEWIADTLIKPFTEVTVKALDVAGDGVVGAMELLLDPKKGLEHGLEKGLAGSAGLAKLAYQIMRDSAALALMPDDSPTRLKGVPAGSKRVAWCQPIPLDEVKAIGHALNCSINDVLLSCVAGALAQYMKSFGDETAGTEVRAMVPVNLRPMDQAYKLGNRFGLAPVVLPLGLDNPVERVFEVRRRMSEMKGSFQPLLAFGLLAVAGLVVKPIQDAMLNLFSRKTTAVMTNVPGPREKLKFCGATLEQSLFWVPQSGSVGLGVSILSYGGGVQFAVISDAALCPDPQQIIDRFEPEFAKLSLLTLMLPWGE